MPETTRRTFMAAAGLMGTGVIAGLSRGAESPPLAPPDKQPPNLKVPEPVPRKIGWAVVGLGKLALEEIMPAFGACRLSRPSALVSGHPDKARQVAKVHGIEAKHLYDYQTFDRLKDDPDVDVVYIVLPNSMHAEFTIRALKAGKHVLCEKPMSVTVEESEAMIAAAREANRKLMIAYRLHYEPYNQTVMKMCEEKAIGELRTISSSHCQVVKAPNIRLSQKLGGGPVGDLGVYSINAARYITREEPVDVTAYARQPEDDPRFREVPASVSFQLRFPSGVLAHCDCSFDAAESRRYRVHGTEGYIDMDPAFSYSGLRLYVGRPSKREEIVLVEPNQFASEMDHFSHCVLNDQKPRTPGEDGLADMRIIQAIDEAARTGKVVAVKR